MLTRTSPAQRPLPYHRTTVPVALQIERLDADLRRELLRLVDAIGHVPDRAFTEIAGRAAPRPMGTRTLAKALIAARRTNAPRERIMAVAFAFVGWTLALFADEDCPRAAWRAETREQAEADPYQAEAAWNDRDVAAIERAIEETRDELAAKHRLYAALLRKREALCGA